MSVFQPHPPDFPLTDQNSEAEGRERTGFLSPGLPALGFQGAFSTESPQLKPFPPKPHTYC